MKVRKPRVCFLVGGREGGGASRSILQLLERIDRDAFDVRIATCEYGPYAVRLREAGQSCDVLGVGWPPPLRHLVVAEAKRSWLGCVKIVAWMAPASVALARYVRSQSIDIIHSNYYHFHLVSGLVAGLLRRKCLWHWRGVLDRRWVPWVSPVVRRLTARHVWSVANSQATLESVRCLGSEHLSLVYNGVALTEPDNCRDELRTMLGLAPGVRIVGLVGSLTPIKGHTHFLEAAARVCRQHDDVHFAYIGGETAEGQRDYLASLQARRRQLRLEERVHFLGHRPDAPRLVAGFDIATVCTLPPGEGFGLVIVEAMAQAVPVISTDVGAAVEILSHDESGILIPPADPEALAQAIHGLLCDDQRRETLARRGYAVCRERFDINKTVRGIEEVYRRVLAL